jgi:prepilin-type N-terminal cleavage/methylation domain-containing protein
MPLTFPQPHARFVAAMRDQRGFTLIELMVSVLIIGILLAIVLPAWLNQRAKGEDTDAKAMIRTTALALETHRVNEYTYNATPAELLEVEPAISHARELVFSGTDDTWDIAERSASGTQFRAQRDANGVVTRTCTVHGLGLCKAAADADGNWW